MRKRKLIAIAMASVLSVSLLAACGPGEENRPSNDGEPTWSVASPDGSIAVGAELDQNGQLYFSVKKGDTTVVEESALGLTTSDNLFDSLEFVRQATDSQKIEYTNITGKQKEVTTEYREMTLTFLEGECYLDVIFRAYDDGYSFRYKVRKADGSAGTMTIEDENTHFALPEDARTYGMKYVVNRGIYNNGEFYSYEEKYQRVSYANLTSEMIGFPMLYYTESASGEKIYSLLTESDIYGRDYHGSFLQKDGDNGLKTIHSPASGTDASLEAAYPFTSPWRVGVVGGLDTVVESTLGEDVYDDVEYWKPDNFDSLSEEEKAIYTYDWVDPGCGAWSYLNYDYGGEVTKKEKQREYTEGGDLRKYIDAIAELGWNWYVLDAGWREGDWSQTELVDFIEYANGKGIHIMVWCDSFTSMYTRTQASATLAQWRAWGIEGIKVDFFDGQGEAKQSEKWKLNSQQSLDEHYEMIYQETAKLKMVVDCHGCNIPTAERRKYPHVINREAVRGYEFKNVDAAQTVLLPFTRAAIGPSDFTPAIVPYIANTVTVGHNMGLAITIESGMPTFSDPYTNYASDKVWFDFYKDMPVTWDETRLVAADLEYYTAIARRSGTKWYVGCTGTLAETIEFDLSFLGDGNYKATYWKDGATYDTVVKVDGGTVTKDSSMQIEIADKGGFAMILEKI